MHVYNNKMLVSLGSNCPTEGSVKNINEMYNLPLQRVSGFFDWLIVSPKSILQALNFIKHGTLIDVLCNKTNYDLIESKDGYKYPKHKMFDCLYIWHAENFDQDFTEKTIHKLESLLNHKGEFCFVIKNNHNQIIENMEKVGEDPNRFILSYSQYHEICALAKELFNAEVILRTSKKWTRDFPENYQFNIHEPQLQDVKNIFGLD